MGDTTTWWFSCFSTIEETKEEETNKKEERTPSATASIATSDSGSEDMGENMGDIGEVIDEDFWAGDFETAAALDYLAGVIDGEELEEQVTHITGTKRKHK